MYEVILKDDKWWIVYCGRVLSELGGFDDPVTPEVIIKEIKDEE